MNPRLIRFKLVPQHPCQSWEFRVPSHLIYTDARVTLSFLVCWNFFILFERERNRVKRDCPSAGSPLPLPCPQIETLGQWPRILSWSPTWVARTQVLTPSLCSEAESEAEELDLETGIWKGNTGVPSGTLTTKPNTCPSWLILKPDREKNLKLN